MQFDHMAFEVGDLERAVTFYVERLQFRESWRHRNEEEREECVFLERGNVKLELLARLDGGFHRPPTPETPYCPHLAIGVGDLDGEVEQLKSGGIDLLRGPLEVAGKVRWLYFADPDHNVIELVEWLK